MNTEAVVYLARKLHWTRTEIGQLSPTQFNELIKEVAYQEAIDEYRHQHSIASLMAAIYNTIPRKRGSKIFKADDFLRGGIPERNPQRNNLEEIADRHGVKLPDKEIKNRGE